MSLQHFKKVSKSKQKNKIFLKEESTVHNQEKTITEGLKNASFCLLL